MRPTTTTITLQFTSKAPPDGQATTLPSTSENRDQSPTGRHPPRLVGTVLMNAPRARRPRRASPPATDFFHSSRTFSQVQQAPPGPWDAGVHNSCALRARSKVNLSQICPLPPSRRRRTAALQQVRPRVHLEGTGSTPRASLLAIRVPPQAPKHLLRGAPARPPPSKRSGMKSKKTSKWEATTTTAIHSPLTPDAAALCPFSTPPPACEARQTRDLVDEAAGGRIDFICRQSSRPPSARMLVLCISFEHQIVEVAHPQRQEKIRYAIMVHQV